MVWDEQPNGRWLPLTPYSTVVRAYKFGESLMDTNRVTIGYILLAILFIFFIVCLVAGLEYQSYRLDLYYRAIYSIVRDNNGSGE